MTVIRDVRNRTAATSCSAVATPVKTARFAANTLPVRPLLRNSVHYTAVKPVQVFNPPGMRSLSTAFAMREVTGETLERGRVSSARGDARRRQIAASLRDTREKLTSSGSGYRTFDVELLNQFARTRRIAGPAMIGLALVVGAIASLWVRVPQAAAWFAFVAGSVGVSIFTAARYLSVADAATRTAVWQRRFIATELMQGLCWALLVVLLLGVNDTNVRTFVLFIMLLVAAMSAMMSAPVPHAVYAGLLPITVAIIVFMRASEDYRALPLSIMAAVAQIYFIVLARRLYSNEIASLSLRLEKDGLIAELEQSKAISDEARLRAEEANLAKSRFLATMSHELRTPLNAILGFSEVMKNELFGPHQVPSYKSYSADIHSSGEHLLGLINEILDLSRVEAGRYELREEAVSLGEIVEDCAHLLTLRAQKRDIRLEQKIDETLPRIWADERALRQVTLNLLTNAIKFTPQGGTVTLKAGWTASGGQYVSIRDTGPGIPAEEIPVVLSSFGRGTMAQKNADEGSGLGLPIVKGLVELHGGVFSLKSEVRVGTEVIFIMPPQRVMAALPKFNNSTETAPAPSEPEPQPRRRISLRKRKAA